MRYAPILYQQVVDSFYVGTGFPLAENMTETPWGSMGVNDAHIHFFSHRFYSGLAKQKDLENAEALGPVLEWEIAPTEPRELAARWVTELDRNGVNRACLIASAHADEENVAAAVEAYPDRFFGYFMLDPLQPDALERMRKAGANPHLHCVCLFPAMHRYSMQNPLLQPMLEIANANQLAVFVHCGALSVGVRKKLGLPSPFDLQYSNPLDLHGVASRNTGIRFIVPHFGAGMLHEALMLADLCPNVFLDTSSSNQWMKYEALELVQVFRRAIDVVGVERLLFGTDSSFFPRGWQKGVFEQQANVLYELGLSARQAEQIFRFNLERLFPSSAPSRPL